MAKKILIVDDEPDILEITAFRLKGLGYEILKASDGKAAMDMIKSCLPDLLLLDLRLPSLSGYEICATMKEDPALKHIPIILFTASAVANQAEKLKETGADDYLVKPFDAEELLKKVRKFLP